MLKLKGFDAYWCTDDKKVEEMLDSGYIILSQFNNGGYNDICIIAKDNLMPLEYWWILKKCDRPYPFNELVNSIGLTDTFKG